MAGGMGSRYGGLKQVDSFGPNNESILDYSIYDAISAGFNKIVILSSPKLQDYFEKKYKKIFSKISSVSLEIVTQEYLINTIFFSFITSLNLACRK